MLRAEDAFLVELSHLFRGTLGGQGVDELERVLDPDAPLAIARNMQALTVTVTVTLTLTLTLTQHAGRRDP